MMENASTVAQVEAIGAIEHFGGNGKTFAENYPTEYNEAVTEQCCCSSR